MRSSTLQCATLNRFPRSKRECRNGRCLKSCCCCQKRLRPRVQVPRFRAYSLSYPLWFNTSRPAARSQPTWSTAGHYGRHRCNRSTPKRSSNNKSFTVHTHRVDSLSLGRSRLITDLISPCQTQPPRRSSHTAQRIRDCGRG